MADNNGDGTRVLYTGNMDKLDIEKIPGGNFKMTPFLIICVGDHEGNDNGLDYLDSVYAEVKDKLKVPFMVCSSLVTTFVVAEV